MNTDFIKRERLRLARIEAGDVAPLESRIDGFGMNRTPPHVATPAIYGVMVAVGETSGVKRARPESMRRKSQVRDKGHKFHKLDSRGAVPRGVADDSIKTRREVPVIRENTGLFSEVPDYKETDLSAKHNGNARNLHKRFVVLVVKDKKTGETRIIPRGWIDESL